MNEQFDMDALRDRLSKCLEQKGLSLRSASLMGGCGAGYVHGILVEKKDPGLAKLSSVCQACGFDLQYIIFGHQNAMVVEKTPDHVVDELRALRGLVNNMKQLLLSNTPAT